VNLVIAVPTAITALRLLVNQAQPQRPRIDLPGVATASAGLFALVYGVSNAETDSWSAPVTIVALAASAVLLITFVAIERRTTDPLLPLHIVWDRARGGAYASIALAGGGVFGVFLFLTFYMQQNLGFSPLTTGLAFLPMTATVVVAATTVVPGLIIIGLGMGCIFAPSFGTATLGVERHEAGIASAMVNTSQQVGGSVGVALLSTLFASAAASYASSHAPARGLSAAATVHGYTTAFWWAAGIFGLGLLVALLILPSGRQPVPAPVAQEAPVAGGR
jgi:hypothetical protein